MRYHLNIGTNIEPRVATIQRALMLLAAISQRQPIISTVVHSAPWGFQSARQFLNIGITIECALPPLALLRLTQAIERRLGSGAHRDSNGNYCDRLADIDLIACDQFTIHTPTLTLPHPHMAERTFVLQPLRQTAPYWHHPDNGKSVVAMLNAINPIGH